MINAKEAKKLTIKVRENVIDKEVEELCNLVSDCIEEEINEGNFQLCLNAYTDITLLKEETINKTINILKDAHYQVTVKPYTALNETTLFYYISWDIEDADDEEVEDDEPTEKEEDSDEF